MEFGLIDQSEMQSDRDAAVVKYHAGVFREFIRYADLADVIAAGRLFVRIAESGEKVPDDAFASSMDLPTITDCQLFKVQKNGTVKIEKKYAKDAQGLITVFRNRIADVAFMRIYNDKFVDALLHTEVIL